MLVPAASKALCPVIGSTSARARLARWGVSERDESLRRGFGDNLCFGLPSCVGRMVRVPQGSVQAASAVDVASDIEAGRLKMTFDGVRAALKAAGDAGIQRPL